MYAKMLIAVDGSELSERALEHGLELARVCGSEVTVVTVTEPAAVVGGGYSTVAGSVVDPLPEIIAAQDQTARDLLIGIEKRAADQGVKLKTVLVDNSFPAEGIVSTAVDIGADLIVMGSHGRRGFDRLLLGSQTGNVLAHTSIPVLVTR